MTPAQELRAAATKLRNGDRFVGEDIKCSTREFLNWIGSLLASAKLLAEWLESDVDTAEQIGVSVSDEALAVARAINGEAS